MAKAAENTELDNAFGRWKTMAELQLKFVEVLAQHKLETAKAELVAAVAGSEWSVARMKAHVAQELGVVLKRLRRLRAQTGRHVERLDQHAKAISRIRSGEDLSSDQLSRMWAAFTVFERMAPPATIEELSGTGVHAGGREATGYVNVRRPEVPCSAPPASIDNVHALIGWIKRQGYVPRRGTHAYRQVIAAMARIADVANSQIKLLEQYLRDLEKRVYDTWQPVVLAALPEQADVKKIIKLGTT
jgi:hypothetical protein